MASSSPGGGEDLDLRLGLPALRRHLRRRARLARPLLPPRGPPRSLRGQLQRAAPGPWLATRERMREVMHECVRRAGLHDAYVELLCTRGRPAPGSRDPRTCDNRFMAFAIPFVWIADPDKQRRGVDLIVGTPQRIPPAASIRASRTTTGSTSSTGLFEAYERGGETVVLIDGAGHVAEGPGFNVFAVVDAARPTLVDAGARRARRRDAAHDDRTGRSAKASTCKCATCAGRRIAPRRRDLPVVHRRRRDRRQSARRRGDRRPRARRLRSRDASAAGCVLGPARRPALCATGGRLGCLIQQTPRIRLRRSSGVAPLRGCGVSRSGGGPSSPRRCRCARQ